MEITDAMVEQALEAEHEKVIRHYVDKPFWYSNMDHTERVLMHDGMRAALEAVALPIANRLEALMKDVSKIHRVFDGGDAFTECIEDVENWPCPTIQAVKKAEEST